LVKVSFNRFVSSRVVTIRNEVEAENQRLRGKTLNKLEEMYSQDSIMKRALERFTHGNHS